MAETKKAAKPTSKKPAKQAPAKQGIKLPRFLRAIGSYFRGAFQEIKQVHWPSRQSTWASTVAVLLFSGFWVLVVLGLDLLFQSILNNLLT